MFYKKLETRKKGTSKLRTLTTITLFHKKTKFKLGFLIFDKDLKERREYNLKSKNWDGAQELERKQKFLTDDKGMF